MPAIKKEVYNAIKEKLELEQRKIRIEIDSNRYKMHDLVRRQTLLKRELAAIGKLILSMDPGVRP